MKIPHFGAELFQTEGQTYSNTESNISFSQILRTRRKWGSKHFDAEKVTVTAISAYVTRG